MDAIVRLPKNGFRNLKQKTNGHRRSVDKSRHVSRNDGLQKADFRRALRRVGENGNGFSRGHRENRNKTRFLFSGVKSIAPYAFPPHISHSVVPLFFTRRGPRKTFAYFSALPLLFPRAIRRRRRRPVITVIRPAGHAQTRAGNNNRRVRVRRPTTISSSAGAPP